MLSIVLSIINFLWYNVLGLYSISRVQKTDKVQLKSALFLHSVACFINGFVAFLALINMHVMQINGRTIYYLRYVEWTLCTPLLTYEICKVASMNNHQIMIIVSLTVAFCLCGTIAALTKYFWAKIFLGLKGSVFAYIVMYKLFQVLHLGKEQVSHINILTLILIWPMYVATWGIGPDVFDIISGRKEWIIQCALSLLLKTISASYAILTYDEIDVENTAGAGMDMMQYMFHNM